ncbi:sensor histidine kinase [Paenibacillus tuaregi]|uniref:sensor histidine kinase n=1 Tax=Paenibacillus tuaregi TaxID=1816681 RepID=UPI000839471E|nr:sensor histidine kinase [Paenibacillus tuaregi]
MMLGLQKLNTLRNQIFIGFFLVVLVIFSVAGFFIYDQVSSLLKNNAEKHIQQTAVQAGGRLDALMTQIDSLTAQVSGHPYVQQLLLDKVNGRAITFNRRQPLLQIAGSYQAYTPGLESLELYTNDGSQVYPIREGRLDTRIDSRYIQEVNKQKGRLVWIGIDPDNAQSVLAIRRVNLYDRWFSPGGYLIARIQRGYFQLNDPAPGGGNGESILLANDRGQLLGIGDVSSGLDLTSLLRNNEQTVMFQDKEYVMVKQYSEAANWTLIILTPVSYVTKGISALRTVLLVSGGLAVFGFVILSFILSTMLTRPIIHLIRAMRKSRLGVLTPNPEPVSTMELRELNHSYNEMVYHINELIRVVYEKEMLQSRTELKALQAQINPHFLFNTLEAFNWSLEDKGEEELAGLVVAMSKLFRYIISSSQSSEWVTIQEELDQVERYLMLIQMRLGDRLTWNIHVSPETAFVPIPKLLIQPIVENAIKYGVESKIGPGSVTVSVRPAAQRGMIQIAVQDDGPGMDEEALHALRLGLEEGNSFASKSTGVGLVNVQQRLRLYYGKSGTAWAGLRVESGIQKGTRVYFDIPEEDDVTQIGGSGTNANHIGRG